MNNRFFVIISICFSLFIVYGTTIPFDFSNIAFASQKLHALTWKPFSTTNGHHISLSDVVQNVLLFIPVGILGAIISNRIRWITLRFFLVVSYGAFLSALVETIQLFSITRTTSTTDVMTNTIGTIAGFMISSVLYRLLVAIKSRPFIKNLLNSESFVLFLAMVFIIIVTSMQPFDFSLEVGTVYSKIKGVLHNPFVISLSAADDFWVLYLYAILMFLTVKNFRYVIPKPYSYFFLFIPIVLSIALEFSQFIIISRMPEFGDILVAITGMIIGSILYLLLNSNEISNRLLIFSGFIVSIICKNCAPFQYRAEYLKMNLIPFFSEYSRTTMTSLGNTIESVILFSFGGFLSSYFLKTKKLRIIAIVLLLSFIALSEFMQGWIKDRYPDLTDIIVGSISLFFGIYIYNKFQNYFLNLPKGRFND